MLRRFQYLGLRSAVLFRRTVSADCRWVDLLAEKTGWEVRNEGMSGREIPRGIISIPDDTDLLIVMLGTNDLLQGAGVNTVADRMEAFLRGLPIERKKILLIAPPPMKRGAWVPDDNLIIASAQLARRCRTLSERLGVRFADPGEWKISLSFDGVHFTGEGHKIFAEALWKELI